MFSGFSSISTVPSGSSSKAALVGANTVNGPSPLSVSTSPAAFTAATSVVRLSALEAFSTMVIFGDIGAPPTMGMSCAIAGAAKPNAPMLRAVTAARTVLSLVCIKNSPWLPCEAHSLRSRVR